MKVSKRRERGVEVGAVVVFWSPGMVDLSVKEALVAVTVERGNGTVSPVKGRALAHQPEPQVDRVCGACLVGLRAVLLLERLGGLLDPCFGGCLWKWSL